VKPPPPTNQSCDAPSAARIGPNDMTDRAWPTPSAVEEGRAFWRMRMQLTRTLARQILSTSRLRLTLIVVLSLALWLGIAWLFFDGFRFLKTAIPHAATYARTVHAVFSMFFAALMVMLVFSLAVLLYGGLFRAEDVPLLLSLPARTERVFLHKYQEAVWFGCWAFLLLGSPMLLAYGLVADAPWYYYALLPAFLAAFTYIPAGVGALACLAVAWWAPRGRAHFVAVGFVAMAAVAVWIGFSVFHAPGATALTPDWFQQVVARAKFSEHQLLPSWWLSSGLLEAAGRGWDQSILFLCLLFANALLLRQLSIATACRVYRGSYDRLQGRGTARRDARPLSFDNALARLIPLPRQMRLLLIKDFRLFRRDPVQWSQFLVFFGLSALYFMNIRRFGSDMRQVGWVNMVSFLNLSVVGLILSTLTTRFIFPMISLEGRRFWMLGLLPVRRETILWSKFLFAAGGSLAPCMVLVFFSDTMLGVPGLIQASHQLTCALLCLGLSGIAVGFGAKMPNFREQSPSRIAAGFGGTLNLVVSAAYIALVVALTALPCHFYVLAHHALASEFVAARPDLVQWLNLWLAAGTLGSIVLGVLATVLPLRMGFRAFREMEF
jgi:ABC-2 type transport system permease protein